MSLTWPWALTSLLLVPLLLAFVWWSRRRRRRTAVRVTSLALVRAAVPRRSHWTRRVPPALLVLGLLVLGIGAARPQASVPVPANATTILLAMDVSRSMCATDVDPNRLAVAQKAATEFIKSQKSGARLGLVAFAGTAGLLVPPTDDTDKLLKAIDGFTVSRGTAIGQAILTALDAIAEVDPTIPPTSVDVGGDGGGPGAPGSGGPTAYVPHAIVLLTDGANTQGVDPLEAAQQAADRRVRVYTIGFGTTDPVPSVCSSSQIGDSFLDGGFGGLGGTFRGNPLVIDEDTLTQVADLTGGQYYRAENADQLDDALADLPSAVTVVHEDKDLAAWFAGVGGLLCAAAVGLSLWWNRAVRR